VKRGSICVSRAVLQQWLTVNNGFGVIFAEQKHRGSICHSVFTLHCDNGSLFIEYPVVLYLHQQTSTLVSVSHVSRVRCVFRHSSFKFSISETERERKNDGGGGEEERETVCDSLFLFLCFSLSHRSIILKNTSWFQFLYLRGERERERETEGVRETTEVYGGVVIYSALRFF
jgi:hypothetical protein